MELIKVRTGVFRKSVWATYKGLGFRLEVYVQHNKDCDNVWGPLKVCTYLLPTATSEIKYERRIFTSYAEFRNFRMLLSEYEKENQSNK